MGVGLAVDHTQWAMAHLPKRHDLFDSLRHRTRPFHGSWSNGPQASGKAHVTNKGLTVAALYWSARVSASCRSIVDTAVGLSRQPGGNLDRAIKGPRGGSGFFVLHMSFVLDLHWRLVYRQGSKP